METSVFVEKNLEIFLVEKCFEKIPVLTPKTRFSRRKEYFTSEIVFYSGNLSFCREKLVVIPVFFCEKNFGIKLNFEVFFCGKDRFVIKNTSFNTSKTRFSRKRKKIPVLYI